MFLIKKIHPIKKTCFFYNPSHNTNHEQQPNTWGQLRHTHTFTTHIQNTCTKAQRTIPILQALTSTSWGKQKETIISTYKAITRPILEYASSIWSPTISQTNITRLQTIQNKALRIATGCTADTNIQHLHDETLTLPVKEHLQLHATQLLNKTQLTTPPYTISQKFLHHTETKNNQSSKTMIPTSNTFPSSRTHP